MAALTALYLGAFLLAGLACVASLWRLDRVTDDDTRRGLWGLLLTSAGWAFAQFGFIALSTRPLKLGAYTIGLVLGLAAVGSWLYFCSAYTGRGYHHNATYRRLALAVFGVLVLLKVTNPLHQGYFTTAALAAPFPHLSVVTGPLHWTAMGLSYALAFVGYFMLFELFTEIDLDTRALFALVSVTGLPVVLDLIGVATPYLIDIPYEPLGVAVFAVGVAFGYTDRFDAVQLAGEGDKPVISLDASNRIRDTNRAARALLPDLEGARDTPLAEVLPAVADRLASDDPIIERRPNGHVRYYRVTETPYGTANAGLGRTVVLTDVTDRERYRAELERQNDRLERFASLVSHDLRNPLNVAQARFQLLSEEFDIEADDEHAAALERALTRIDDLIDDILALARQGQPVESTERVSLSSIAEQCWGMVETGDADLDIASDRAFRADPDRLRRLFENLFRNAIDHAGPDRTVTVGALSDDPGFYVADDGPGIPPADRESVFEPGYTTADEGTGFGLAIVAEMATAHGWDVRLRESEAGGARFEMYGVELAE